MRATAAASGRRSPWADRIGAQNIRCDLLDRDRYDRHIGRCFLGDTGINERLVRQGQALACRRFSTDYVPAEDSARRERIGLWQGEFDLPWDCRLGDRRILEGGKVADTGTSESGCAIKGNISRSGKRIYHVPGQQHYRRTQIDQSKGERWFCSAEEANAAGWRRALR